jgi:hypothetical protein
MPWHDSPCRSAGGVIVIAPLELFRPAENLYYPVPRAWEIAEEAAVETGRPRKARAANEPARGIGAVQPAR